MGQPVVLDNSALIAFLGDEPGADIVRSNLDAAVISTVNLSETAAYVRRKGHVPFDDMIIDELGLTVVDFTREQALKAGELIQLFRSKGLSLGDPACLSLGIIRRLPILTADRKWNDLDLDVRINFIR